MQEIHLNMEYSANKVTFQIICFFKISSLKKSKRRKAAFCFTNARYLPTICLSKNS